MKYAQTRISLLKHSIRRYVLSRSDLPGNLTTIQSILIQNNSYVYEPLDKTTDTIRLASFISVHKTSIQISLQTYSLSSAPKFRALSYEWGSPADPKTILLNHMPFSVRKNLWDGLQALWDILILFSNTDEHEPFWVDALCIDQHNVSECNRQVNMMARIYSSAFKVAVG
jgi:hypothetical protein